MTPWWTLAEGGDLAQGDWLRGCLMPVVPDDFGDQLALPLVTRRDDLLVLTQSCDLANNKVRSVTLCPIRPISALLAQDPAYRSRKALEPVRRGIVASLHLLSNPDTPDDNQSALYLDFRQLVILPVGYLQRHAAQLGPRHRLNSPYLEHLSQSFARFFMRVGLPADIPPYTN